MDYLKAGQRPSDKFLPDKKVIDACGSFMISFQYAIPRNPSHNLLPYGGDDGARDYDCPLGQDITPRLRVAQTYIFI